MQVGGGQRVSMMRARLSAASAGMLWRFRLFGLCGGGLDDIERDGRHREQSADTGDVVNACWVGQRASVLSEISGPFQNRHPHEFEQIKERQGPNANETTEQRSSA
jgi:hypothetical protein